MFVMGVQAQIVNNSGTSSEDSITMFVNSLDSAGNMTPADSFYVRVFKSNANAVIFSDSGTCANMGRLDSASGKSHYYFHAAVADIDGAGDIGTYVLLVIARKTTGASLYTPNQTQFQITAKEFSDALDSAGLAALKTSYLPSVTAGGTGGVFIAGTNAATSITTSLTVPQIVGRIDSVRGVGTVPSTVSTLTASDNIGINWADIAAPTTTVGLSGTSVLLSDGTGAGQIDLTSGTVQVGFINTDAITAAAVAGSAALEIRDTAFNRIWRKASIDSSTSLSDSTFISNNFVEGANFWRTYKIRFFYGTAQSQAAVITKTELTANGKNRFYIYPKLVTAPALADSFAVDLTSRADYGSQALAAYDSLKKVEAAIYAKVFTTTDTSLRIKLIDGTGANPDTVLTRTSASSLTATQVADTVWKRAFFATPTGSFADSSKGWGATSASSLTASDIWHYRVDTVTTDSSAGEYLANANDTLQVYDAAGHLSVTVSDILADVIGESEIAPNSITSSEIGADAIGASEIAADAIGASEVAADAVGASELNVDAAREINADWFNRDFDSAFTAPGLMDSIRFFLRRLDAAMSSRSTLVATDNVGVNFSDISGTLDASEIGTDAITSDEMALTAIQEIEAALYAKHFTTTDTSLRIKLIDGTGANPDTVLTRTSASSLTATMVADTVWKRPYFATPTGSFADSSKGWGATSASSIDSGTISRIVGRKVWGIAAGVGASSDSTTRAQRKTDIVDTTTVVIGCDTSNADFLLTTANYRNQIKRKMNIAISNTTWETDTVLNELLREAIITVNPIIRGYKTTLTKVTRVDSSDYSLDSLIGIMSVVWKRSDTVRSIPYLPREKWATITPQNTYGYGDAYLERPIVYDYTDNLISLFPVPSTSDTIKIVGFQKIPNITVITQVSEIPQRYRVAVLKYATWLVARAHQHPYAQSYLDEYHESLNFLVSLPNEATNVTK
jgi:hypothetical protein